MKVLDLDGSVNGVHGTDAEHVWAVGNRAIHFFDGEHWEVQATNPELKPRAVWAADPKRAWVVGSGVLSFDGSGWSEQPCEDAKLLFDVTGTDATHVWAVGEDQGRDGAIYFWDGQSWSKQYDSEDNSEVIKVEVLDRERLIALINRSGTSGQIFLITEDGGRNWESRSSGSSGFRSASELFAADADHVWIAGREIWFGDLTSWAEQSSGARISFDGLWGPDANQVWAVGRDDGVILHWKAH